MAAKKKAQASRKASRPLYSDVWSPEGDERDPDPRRRPTEKSPQWGRAGKGMVWGPTDPLMKKDFPEGKKWTYHHYNPTGDWPKVTALSRGKDVPVGVRREILKVQWYASPYRAGGGPRGTQRLFGRGNPFGGGSMFGGGMRGTGGGKGITGR